MKRLLLILLPVLLLASCREKQQPYKGSPAIELSVQAVTHSSATIGIKSMFADEVWLLCLPGGENAPSAEKVLIEGSKADGDTHTLTGLSAGKRYTVFGVGESMSGGISKVEKAEFTTAVEAGDLYSWERGRDGAPFFADITLCTGGGVPNSNSWFTVPMYWDKARFAPHVSYVDDDGEHWLFEAFLAITGIDMEGKNFGINNNGRESAGQDSWEALASYWLDKGGAFDALDQAIGDAAGRIGTAPGKRYVVMVMPDPVMFERFSDKSSSTSYWGVLDGVRLDFARIDDQIKALEWYIELIRSKFAALAPNYLELAGFYILSEELVAKPEGFNYQYKRWDRILPPVGEYLNARNEGLYWIPYLGADGTDIWKSLGIDCAWLQPNYYWDYNNSKPIKNAFKAMSTLDMGMELEFEYSMVEKVMKTNGIMGPDGAGNYVFTLKDVPSLRARFREYMDGYKEAGLYGKKPVALYSGSNALYQLASSKEKDDIAVYLELCRFISDNPLRK